MFSAIGRRGFLLQAIPAAAAVGSVRIGRADAAPSFKTVEPGVLTSRSTATCR